MAKHGDEMSALSRQNLQDRELTFLPQLLVKLDEHRKLICAPSSPIQNMSIGDAQLYQVVARQHLLPTLKMRLVPAILPLRKRWLIR
ncbi:MAG: hypothetical protein L0H63_15925 [Nitrococcus sp.]|nr:hypothetical protein [Nitrococcus sp.]